MLIEVKETHPPVAANRSGTVVAMDGQQFDCWPDKLNGLQVGRHYEIETSRREKNGRTYVSITKATPVNGAAPAQQAGSGQVARSPSGEAEYVGRIVAASILKGDIQLNPHDPRRVEDITRMLRDIWRATSGN